MAICILRKYNINKVIINNVNDINPKDYRIKLTIV